MDLTPFLAGGAAGRPDSVTGFQPDFSAAITQLLSAAPPDIQAALRINSGYRSPELQQQLWDRALAQYGSPEAARRWVAPPGRSQHGHGNAADLQFGNDAARIWAHENASQFGLAFPLDNENWHIELAGARGSPPAAAPAMAAPPAGGDPTGAQRAALVQSLAPMMAPRAPAPVDFGSIVANGFGQQQQRQQADAERQAAERGRRVALIDSVAQLYG